MKLFKEVRFALTKEPLCALNLQSPTEANSLWLCRHRAWLSMHDGHFPSGPSHSGMFLGLKAVVPSHMISSSHVRTRKNTSMKLPTFLGNTCADKKGLVADAYQVEGLRGINLGVETIRERGAVEGKPQLQNSRDKGLHKTLKGNKTVSNFW